MAAPGEVGLDPEALTRAGEALGAGGERQGVVVVRHGVIAFERYWENRYFRAQADWPNPSFSSGKSWGSAMVGRAVTLGLFGLDDLVAPWHPPAHSGLHPAVTVRHLLTMTSGGTLVVKPSTRLPPKLDEAHAPGPGDEYRRLPEGERGSPTGYGVSIEPGTRFYYDGAPADHLANVVASAAGMPSLSFMMDEVVAPLGCETLRYQPEGVDGAGNVRIGGSLLLSCRDLARLGLLFLRGGRWDGAPLIAAEYAAAASTPSALHPDYGLLWWLNTTGHIPGAPVSMFFAGGAFGQYCFVLPDHDLVVATMGFGRNPLSPQRAWEILEEVLPR